MRCPFDLLFLLPVSFSCLCCSHACVARSSLDVQARPLDIDAIEIGLTKSIASVNEQYNHYLGQVTFRDVT
jgi:hypothetical protein